MAASFKKSIVIPLATYKKLRAVEENQIKKEESDKNPIIERQREILAQKMYNVQPYKVLSTNQDVSKKTPLLYSNFQENKSENSPIGISIEEILSHIRPAQLPYIKEILKKMLDLQYFWNNQGEIMIRGRLLKNSNVIDIMKYFSNASIKNEPSGIEELWYNLSPHVPKSWFLNKPKKIKKKTDSYIIKKYPLEDLNMEAIKKQQQQLYEKIQKGKIESSEATDDEYSEDDDYETPAYKKSYSGDTESIDDDYIKDSDINYPAEYGKGKLFSESEEEANKKDEASGGIEENIKVKKIKPPSFEEKKFPDEREPIVTKPFFYTPVLKKTPKEDIFGDLKERKTTSPKKRSSPYRTRYGRSSKTNPKYSGNDWTSKWKNI